MANGVLSSPYFWGAASQGLAQGAQNFNQGRMDALMRRMQQQQAERDQQRWEAEQDFRERELALRRMQALSNMRRDPPEPTITIPNPWGEGTIDVAQSQAHHYLPEPTDPGPAMVSAPAPWDPSQMIQVPADTAWRYWQDETDTIPTNYLLDYREAQRSGNWAPFREKWGDYAIPAGQVTEILSPGEARISERVANNMGKPWLAGEPYSRLEDIANASATFEEAEGQRLANSLERALFDYNIDSAALENEQTRALIEQANARIQQIQAETDYQRAITDPTVQRLLAQASESRARTEKLDAETEWQRIQNELERQYGPARIEGELNYRRAQTALTEARAHWQRHQTDFVPVERIYAIMGIPESEIPEGARGQSFYRDEMPMIFDALETLIREGRDPAQFTTLGVLLQSVGQDTSGMQASVLNLPISAENALDYVNDNQLSILDTVDIWRNIIGGYRDLYSPMLSPVEAIQMNALGGATTNVASLLTPDQQRTLDVLMPQLTIPGGGGLPGLVDGALTNPEPSGAEQAVEEAIARYGADNALERLEGASKATRKAFEDTYQVPFEQILAEMRRRAGA